VAEQRRASVHRQQRAAGQRRQNELRQGHSKQEPSKTSSYSANRPRSSGQPKPLD
jgi:hypothetical protein